jgi:spermidine/putrescine transport system permease protein
MKAEVNKHMKKALLAYSWCVLLFLYVPIMVLVVYSFNDSRMNAEWSGFTLHWYYDVLGDPNVIGAFANSMWIASVTTVVATVAGTLCALGLYRYTYRFQHVLQGLIYLPILVPDILMGLSLLILFSQLQLELGKVTIMIAHVTFSISFVVVVVTARLAGMGRELEDAALDLGATPWQTFRYITLPCIMPGIIAAALLTFTLSIDDFVISFFVSGPGSTTLPLYIYSMVKRGITPEINALSTMLIVLIIVLMIIAERFRTKKQGSGRLPL